MVRITIKGTVDSIKKMDSANPRAVPYDLKIGGVQSAGSTDFIYHFHLSAEDASHFKVGRPITLALEQGED